MNRTICCALSAMLLLAVGGCATDAMRPDIQAAAVAEAADPVVRQLRDGGYVIYIRHGKTEQAFQDQVAKPTWWKSCDVRMARPLSDEGRQQMLAIGNHIRALRIPVARVVTSEYCRAFDSGLLLQLIPVEMEPKLNFPDAQRMVGRNDETIRNDMRALLSAPPPPGRNVIFVAHVHGFNPPVDPVFQQLAEGEAAVIKPSADGKIVIVGRITVEKWAERVKR